MLGLAIGTLLYAESCRDGFLHCSLASLDLLDLQLVRLWSYLLLILLTFCPDEEPVRILLHIVQVDLLILVLQILCLLLQMQRRI